MVEIVSRVEYILLWKVKHCRVTEPNALHHNFKWLWNSHISLIYSLSSSVSQFRNSCIPSPTGESHLLLSWLPDVSAVRPTWMLLFKYSCQLLWFLCHDGLELWRTNKQMNKQMAISSSSCFSQTILLTIAGEELRWARLHLQIFLSLCSNI